MNKPELEFFDVDSIKWKPVDVPGYSGGCYEKILSYDDDTGSVTRLIRIEPGAKVTGALTHDFWEEVYIIRGELVDIAKKLHFKEGYYGCRPPGMVHGPYETAVGCMIIEFRYFPDREAGKQGLGADVKNVKERLDSIGQLQPWKDKPATTFKP